MLLLSDPVTEGLFSLGTGAISGIASLFGADAQSKNVKRTNEMNYKIAQESNATQQQIARENNEMQLQAMRENNAFNKQSAIDMFNLEAAYNTPLAEKQRLLEAGINPATLYGQGGSVGGSVNASTPSASGSGISPSMPSMSVPTMQTPPSVLNMMFGNIESITRSIGNLAKSGLDKMQKKSIGTTLQAQLDKIIEETKGVEIRNQWDMFKKNIDIAYLGRKTQKEIEKISADIFKAYAEGGAAHAAVALNEASARLTDEKYKQLHEQAPWLLDNIKKLGELYSEEAETEKSKQSANYAGAKASESQSGYYGALTQTENALRDARVNFQKIQNGIAGYDFLKKNATFQQDVKTTIALLLNAPEVSQAEKDLLKEKIALLKKQNTWYNWKQFEETCDKILNHKERQDANSLKLLDVFNPFE